MILKHIIWGLVNLDKFADAQQICFEFWVVLEGFTKYRQNLVFFLQKKKVKIGNFLGESMSIDNGTGFGL